MATKRTTSAARRKHSAKAKPRTTTRSKKRPPSTQIVAADQTAACLLPANRRNSLVAWFQSYMAVEGGEPGSHTHKAKTADLSRFANYFQEMTGADQVDQWTRSISQRFVKHLLKTRSERTGRKLAPNTINRVLATVRNVARWVHRQRPFLAGNPMERISDVHTPEPEWRGLSDIAVTRLKAAAEQRLHVSTRADQNALRDRALLLILLDTALRVSELIALDLDQYQGKHFHHVRRKGNKVTARVFIGKVAKEALDHYIDEVRSDQPGPLFQSKHGNQLAPQNIADALGKVVGQANAHLSKKQHLSLTPHVLRHTALRKMAEKKGVRYAQQMAGHVSSKYIWRYVQPSADEMEEAIEDLFD